MSFGEKEDMPDISHDEYERPTMTVLGTVAELTQVGDVSVDEILLDGSVE